MGTASESSHVWRLLASHLWQQASRWVHGGMLFRLRPASNVPTRVLIAPQDLRTADAMNAADIYGGRFLFSGHLVETHGESPFELYGQERDWQRELHGFGWLRDLRAADSKISRQNARVLIDDWIKLCGSRHPVGWETPVVARRIMSWLSHSPFVLDEGDHDFYRRFLKSLAKQVAYLRRTINETHDGVERLQAALAIASACVSMAGQGRYARQAMRRLDTELARQILPVGGHISRNPGAMIEILADLLPVRQAFVMQGMELPKGMLQSVDRMMPLMRFFRHGDGAIAHFNGMGSTPNDLIATIMGYDDARGAPPTNAPHAGYQRLVGGDATVLLETGKPPPPGLSLDAHAGCLSFEFSSGIHRLVVNCGVSGLSNSKWRQVSRSTAAHSTVSIGDTSSCRFLTSARFGKWLGNPIMSGPSNVSADRTDSATSSKVSASHDGYLREFQVVHERDLRLSADGTELSGIDKLLAKGPINPEHYYTIRFHIHPQIKASLHNKGSLVQLVCPDGETWEFDAPGAELHLEDSIYLSDVYGHRKTSQIIIYGMIQEMPSVAWQFRRTVVARLSRRGMSDFDEADRLPEDPGDLV